MSNEPSDDRPRTEEEWERLLRKSEVRSAKFGELLETLRDDPNRNALIAREMGWDRNGRDDRPDFEWPEWEDAGPVEEWEESERPDDESLRMIPAYARGFEWGLSVYNALQQYLEGKDEWEPDDPLVVAFSDSLVVAAKIAGGHGLGYDDDVLCGNIVCCKRSLEAAERSVAALEKLAERGTVPAETIQPLLEEGGRVRELVEQHIAQLRSRVWW